MNDAVRIYCERFVYVDEHYSRQQPDGRYRAMHEPLTPAIVEAHLRGARDARGAVSLGLYLTDSRDTCMYGVLDHDGVRRWRDPDGTEHRQAEDGLAQLWACKDRLARNGIEAAVEASQPSRGHLWVFMKEPTPAVDVRTILRLAMGQRELERRGAGDYTFEMYPKSDTRGARMGSQIRAPFGVHQRTGQRYPFVDQHNVPVTRTMGGQISYAARVERVDALRGLAHHPGLADELRRIEAPADRDLYAPQTPRLGREVWAGRESLFEQWKAEHGLDAVLAYYNVQVPRYGNASCPIGDHHANGDKTPSLSIDRDRGLWHCHTAGVGGDAIKMVQLKEGFTRPKEALDFCLNRWPLRERQREPEPARSGRG
jgi:hypothetical protein